MRASSHAEAGEDPCGSDLTEASTLIWRGEVLLAQDERADPDQQNARGVGLYLGEADLQLASLRLYLRSEGDDDGLYALRAASRAGIGVNSCG